MQRARLRMKAIDNGATRALAQHADTAYPTRPIRTLVGFQPSGGRDMMARAAGQKLAERWNSPQLPTIAAAGLPGYDVAGCYGLVAPAGTPAAIVRKLSGELGRAMHAPEVAEKLAAEGSEAFTGTPEEFKNTIAREIDKWTQLFKTTGLKL